MNAQTFTPAQARSLTIEATEDLLRGWVGPRRERCSRCRGANIRLECSYCGDSTYDHACNDGCRECGGAGVVVLELSCAAARDHLIRVAAEGVACGDCPGDGVCPAPGLKHECHECSGTGWYRQPADLSIFRDGPGLTAPGWTSAELSALLLWTGWRRMEAGMGPLRALFGPASPRGSRKMLVATQQLGPLSLFTDEAPGDRDAVWMSSGFALLNDDGTITAEAP